MAVDNTYSDIWIGDDDQTNKIYMDIDPVDPVFIPIPEGRQITKKCLPGLNESAVVEAGECVHCDFGASISDTTIEWSCSKAEESTFTALLAKYSKIEDVTFSLDGTTIYLAQWVRPEGLVFSKTGRTSNNTYSLSIRLKIVELLA